MFFTALFPELNLSPVTSTDGDLFETKFSVLQCNHLLLQPSVARVSKIGPGVGSSRLCAAQHGLAHAVRQEDSALDTQNFLHLCIVVPAEREGFLSELGKPFARTLKSLSILRIGPRAN